MPTLYRPGSYVQEGPATSFATTNPAVSIYAFVGAHSQGPLTPTPITSWRQFQQLYGGFGDSVPTYLSLSVYNFFASGGSQCYVVRVVHTTSGGTVSATASATLVDTEGSPQATIVVSALSPGLWGNSVYVKVLAPTDGISTHFNLLVYSGGTANGNVVETWANLSMSQSDSRYFATVLNNQYTGSAYITVTDLQGTTTTPGHVPAVLASPLQLGTGSGSTLGVDGTAPTAAENTAALALLNTITAPMVIAMPGVTDSSSTAGLIGYCSGRGDCFAVIDPPAGQTVAQMTGMTAAGGTTNGTGYVDYLGTSSYAAVFYPWIVISDPSSSLAGSIRTVPPSGFVMGAMQNTDNKVGSWQTSAGALYGSLPSAVGLQTNLAPADLDNLNSNNVNAITSVPNAGLCIFGGRTLSPLQGLIYIAVRRLMIFVEASLRDMLQALTWAPNDSDLWNTINVQASNFLQNLYAQGAMVGSSAAQAFFVTCDDTVNTAQTIAAGQVIVEVGIAPVNPAEFLVTTVSQWLNGASANPAGSISG